MVLTWKRSLTHLAITQVFVTSSNHRRLCRVKNMVAMYLKYFRYIASIFLTLHKRLCSNRAHFIWVHFEKLYSFIWARFFVFHWGARFSTSYISIGHICIQVYVIKVSIMYIYVLISDPALNTINCVQRIKSFKLKWHKVLTKMDVIVSETNKKKKCLIYDRFTFRVDRILKNNDISWRCTNNKSKCKANFRLRHDWRLAILGSA